MDGGSLVTFYERASENITGFLSFFLSFILLYFFSFLFFPFFRTHNKYSSLSGNYPLLSWDDYEGRNFFVFVFVSLECKNIAVFLD